MPDSLGISWMCQWPLIGQFEIKTERSSFGSPTSISSFIIPLGTQHGVLIDTTTSDGT